MRNLLCFFLLVSALSTTIAEAYTISNKSIAVPAVAPTLPNEKKHPLSVNSAPKMVYLMQIELTPAEKQHVINLATAKIDKKQGDAKSDLPRKIDLGMNGVPPLDQGMHGSCVTFATVAALDAILGKGDYISPLCNLTLGNYLADKGYLPSGWNGTSGFLLLNQIMQFGILNKSQQKELACGGLTDYPVSQATEGGAMSLEDYKAHSENIFDRMFWHPLLTVAEYYDDSYSIYDANNILNQVKRFLALAAQTKNSPMRITFGTQLPGVGYCPNGGACGSYHVANDTWVNTTAIEANPHLGSGHEMVIIGYDDDAIVTDNEGNQHQGILILRNSWGNYGDNGNFYMSYEFFQKYANEIQEIRAYP